MTANAKPSLPSSPRYDEDGFLYGPDGYTDADRPDEDSPDMSTPYWEPIIRKAIDEQRPQNEAKLAALRRAGRPPSAARKVQVTLRLDPDILARVRATGPGWQTRLNAMLRAAFPDDPA